MYPAENHNNNYFCRHLESIKFECSLGCIYLVNGDS